MGYEYYEWKPYVSVAERKRIAAREMAKRRKAGHPVSPVTIEGRTIARTFWGKAWCDNLERYSDFSNRLPRGRTYVRNGSVVDLQVAPGKVQAFVSGSEIYKVAVKVSAVPHARWTSICSDCSGAIDSLVELLQGRFSKGVMERICQQQSGLFPAPTEIAFSCSCPDWASMCKHVAAVLYGIGARLDEKPELLFKLREVDEKELIARAGKGLPLSKQAPTEERVLAAADLSELFGLEMGTTTEGLAPIAEQARSKPTKARRSAKRLPTAAAEAKAKKAATAQATKKAAKAKANKSVAKAQATKKAPKAKANKSVAKTRTTKKAPKKPTERAKRRPKAARARARH